MEPREKAICQICQNVSGNKSYIFREMMFGSGEEFEYFECAECGCLQIKKIPDNLLIYYPDDYFSFQKPSSLKDNFLKAFFKGQRAKSCLLEKNFLRTLLSQAYRPPDYYEWFKKVEIQFESHILDVGCGAGHLLLRMKKDGFLNLTGIDAFIKDSIFYENGVNILKKDISEIRQEFDFIMLHHSYEHMPHPISTIKELYRLLKPKRYVLIRIPVASSFAWKKYGDNWVQLDVPRHLFLHTIRSIKIMADRVGFKVADIVFDSTAFQFWGSEQYFRDIPLRDARSYEVNSRKSIFSKKQIKSFEQKAIELNKNHDGDQACFYLYKE